MNIDAHKQFVLQKKVFFIKENNFFQKNMFFSSRKTIFFQIYKNLTALAFLLPRQILQKWRYASAKASAFAAYQGKIAML